MSQSNSDKALAAEERSQETKSFVRRVRSVTRRKYTSEEKIRIVLEGFRREVTVNDLCRREDIKPHSYYSWTKEFMEAGKERLARDAVRDATQREVQQLRRENEELKQLVGISLWRCTASKKRPSQCPTTPPVSKGERHGEGGDAGQGGLIPSPQTQGPQRAWYP